LQELLSPIPAEPQPLPDDIEDILEEAKQLLEQLKLEKFAVSDRKLRSTVDSQYMAFQTQIRDIERRILLNQAAPGTLNDEERHEQNMHRLRYARDQLLQSEEVGKETLVALHEQEETLKRVNANVRKTNDELSTSNKLLNRMGKWWRG